MKNWRVVRVQKDGTLYVLEETTFWTKKGAQEAATHLNCTFGALVNLASTMLGHNFFVAHISKIDMLHRALELAKRNIPTKQ
jgi:hypothetical protein